MLRPQPALLPCQQLHCVREERAAAESGRASEQQPERAGERESERAGEGARRRPRLRSARLPATLPQRRAPCAPSRRHRWGPAGCRRRQGSGWDRGPRLGTGAPWCSGARGGRQLRCSARPLNCVGRRAVGLRGAPRAGRPDSSGGAPIPGSAQNERAPHPHWTLRSSPAYPTSAQTFPTPSPVGVAESAGLPAGLPPRGTLATLTSCLS